jgi:cell division septation protein DedD
MQNDQRRTFEVTGVQIWIGIIVAAIVLTVVFEVGVLVGKRRVIRAEMEAARQYDMHMRAAAKTSTEVRLPHRSPSDQTREPSEAKGNTSHASPSDQPDQLIEQPEREAERLQYTVQVGTFGSRQNAENMVNLLRSYEYESWLSPEAHEEKTLHCVFVGRFDTKDEAEQFGKSMQKTLSYVTEYRVSRIQE